jgi:hypothetical protein
MQVKVERTMRMAVGIWSREAEPAERFRALGIGYVRCSRRALLVQAITGCHVAGQVRGGDLEAFAVAAWSIVHGRAALLVDGKLKGHATTTAAAERLAHTITDCFMLGLAPRA